MISRVFLKLTVGVCGMLGILLVGIPFPTFAVEEYGLGYDKEVKWLKVPESDTKTEERFLNVVKGGFNRVLGILALVLLLMLIRWGVQMMTANGDDGKYKAGFTILKNAAMWLAILGAAWFIISIIFYVITLVANDTIQNAGTDST